MKKTTHHFPLPEIYRKTDRQAGAASFFGGVLFMVAAVILLSLAAGCQLPDDDFDQAAPAQFDAQGRWVRFERPHYLERHRCCARRDSDCRH